MSVFRDLYLGINALQEEGRPVFIFGTSYGTLWANRFMVMFPQAAVAGAILESVVDPRKPNFVNYDTKVSEVGRSFLNLCKASANCTALWDTRLPYSTAKKLIDDIAAGMQQCVRDHFPFLSGPEGAALLKSHVLFGMLFQVPADIQ